MKLGVLLERMGPVTVSNPGDPDVKGVTYDSRKVKPGYVFVALRGRNQDGNQFVQDAIDRGAAAIVADEPSAVGRTQAIVIGVPDKRRAMAEAACAIFEYPSRKLQVIGITGTNGKTTIAFMVRDILSAAGRKPGMIGTVQYEIGDRIIPAERTTPESPDLQNLLAQMVHVGCRSAIMEVSSHALVQQRVGGIEFDAAVFTNLTHDHLDYHGNMEDYFEAKSLLFRMLGQGDKRALAVINMDDPWGVKLVRMKRDSDVELITYGMHPDASVRATRLDVSAGGSVVHVRGPWGDSDLRLHLLGRFNVCNALAAFACCAGLGVEPAGIARALSGMVSVRGRLEDVQTGLGFHVFVDYAHTEDALKNVLTTLREVTSGRLIVIFGCGGNRDRKKRPLMGATVARLADYAVLTSDNPRKEAPSDIIAAIRKGFEGHSNYDVVEDRREAIRKGLSVAREGDVVLIAGKGHENYQEMADRIIPFDDRQVVRELLGFSAE